MKKLLLILSAVCLFAGFLPARAAAVKLADDKPNFCLFVSPTCVHCNKLKHEYWQGLKDKYKDTVNFVELDISKDGNNLILPKRPKHTA